jgi:hypothetical protein
MKPRSLLAAIALLGALGVAGRAAAQPSATQVLTDAGFSAADIQRALDGEFVSGEVKAVSDRDLSLSLAFLVKTSPDSLSQQVMGQHLVGSDPQIQAWSELTGAGGAADLAKLQVTKAAAQTFLDAAPGDAINLSSDEIAAFNALKGSANPQQAVQAQLRNMLLARYRAYLASGLAGIAPYARGGGRLTDVAADLREVTNSLRLLQKDMPAFQTALLDYPKDSVAGSRQSLYWVRYDISGKPTYVLTQVIAAPIGAARVIAQRQYYVSSGYNTQQAVVGLLPVQEGTLVLYSTHVLTDQVGGFGSSAKQAIGRRMMASQLQAIFEKERTSAAR